MTSFVDSSELKQLMAQFGTKPEIVVIDFLMLLSQ